MSCPYDYEWFGIPDADDTAHMTKQVECSGKGVCDRTVGVCYCNLGFTGAACQYMSCPGDSNPCYGHGQCLDMATLATLKDVNGELAGYTYGLVPNDPSTWDATRIYGCHCDAEYQGYDCNQLKCLHGDDPDTANQFDEVQLFTCTDADAIGSFILTFREKSTTPILPSATIAQLKTALEGLSTIGELSITTVDPASTIKTVCAPSPGQKLNIQFLTEHADLPMIRVKSLTIDSLHISESIRGNKEVIECSGRGICDYLTGFCKCFSGYGSSDRRGGHGPHGDCGFIEPLEVAGLT